MKRFSIRRRLVLMLSVSLLVVWAAMLISGYVETREEAHELAEARLEESAAMLMLLDLPRLNVLAQPDAVPRKEHDKDGDDDDANHVRFQVWRDDGTLLVRSTHAPQAAFLVRNGHALIAAEHKQWHSFAVHDANQGFQIRVFEASGLRDSLANKTALRMAQILLPALVVLALLIWFSVGRAMRPLLGMTGAIAQRGADNLEPISLESIPAEVQPLVDSLNHLLDRLAHSIDKERAFTADAAHELRTPLAAIKVQAEVALGARDDIQRSHAIHQVIAGVNRTTRLVQQLLLLARLDHPDSATMQPVDLGALAVECAGRKADAALRKDIELDLSTEPGCILHGDATALSLMLDNLIDNAIKYGRQGGRIAIAVTCDGSQLLLSVRDDGAGVPAADWPRLSDRFYRAPGNEADGSGLGLSIVAKIAQAYRGDLRFSSGIDGAGLGVTIHFRP